MKTHADGSTGGTITGPERGIHERITIMSCLSFTERLELDFHRAYLRAGAQLAGIRHRLELLEKPRVNLQAQQEAQQQEHIDRFWQLTDEAMKANPDLRPQDARALVLSSNPELRSVYPRIQN